MTLTDAPDDCKITFAGYRLPEGADDCPGDLDDQKFVGAETKTLSADEEEQFAIQI